MRMHVRGNFSGAGFAMYKFFFIPVWQRYEESILIRNPIWSASGISETMFYYRREINGFSHVFAFEVKFAYRVFPRLNKFNFYTVIFLTL